ncbi:hypothetical protein ACFLQN_02605 [Candidatus Aenigmatarchaeota archaeon]
MEKQNIVILLAIMVSLVVISLPINIENTISKSPLLLQDSGENITLYDINNETKVLESPIISTNYFETLNGMVITEEKYANFLETEKTVNIDISFAGKKINFDQAIPGNRIWSYVTIDGVLVIPSNAARFDLEKTSHYSEKILVTFKSSDAKKVDIYTIKKEIPSFIETNTDSTWNFDQSKGLISIKSDNGPIEIIEVYYVDFVTRGTVFIEDTEQIENLDYKNTGLINQEKTFSSSLLKFEEDVETTRNELNKLAENITTLTEVRNEIRSIHNQLNETVSLGENTISGAVLLEPSIAAIWLIVTIILIVLCIDIIFFRKRGRKK